MLLTPGVPLMSASRISHADRSWNAFAASMAMPLSFLLILCFLLNAGTAVAQTVSENDFEDGSPQGWIPRGTALLTNTTEAAHGGSHSLKTTGRTAGFHGPSLNLLNTLQKGNVYEITAVSRIMRGRAA